MKATAILLLTLISTNSFAERVKTVEKKEQIGSEKLLSVHGCSKENISANIQYDIISDKYSMNDGQLQRSVERKPVTYTITVKPTLVKEHTVRTYKVALTYKKRFFSREEYLASEEILEDSYSSEFTEKRSSLVEITSELQTIPVSPLGGEIEFSVNPAAISNLLSKCAALEATI
jgi:hypothetical protein